MLVNVLNRQRDTAAPSQALNFKRAGGTRARSSGDPMMNGRAINAEAYRQAGHAIKRDELSELRAPPPL
jgi:hypothetical protein